MSKFRPGDRVRVVRVTTHEGREPITNPNHPGAIDWTGTALIGRTGTVTDLFPKEFADTNVRFDHLEQLLAFNAADLELAR